MAMQIDRNSKLNCMYKVQAWAVSVLIAFSNNVFAQEKSVEVFHYWTTASEAKSINVLKSMTASAGYNWIDATVEGAAGENAFSSLKSRVLSANAPDLGQIKGRDIQRWARLGMLNPLTDINQQSRWQMNLPTEFLNHLKLEGELYAIPLHIHRTNWLWMHKPTLEQFGLKPPKSWEELEHILSTLKKNNVPVIAQSLEGWQLATMFEGLLLATKGPDFYRQVFVDLSYSAARSQDMVDVFEKFRTLHQYFIVERKSATWDSNAISVADGKANLMFMGDWMKGELTFKKRVIGSDYICVPTPGQYSGFIYDVNSFASFKNKNGRSQNAKDVLTMVLTSEFQTEFNQYKGSMPIHPYVERSDFDDCTQTAMSAFELAQKSNSLVPSVAHGLANINGVQHGLFEGLEKFANTPSMTAEEGSKFMANRMRYGAYYITN